MDNRNWEGMYFLDNVANCEYNMDNGYVLVYFKVINILRINCEEIEVNLNTTEQSLAKPHKLLDDKPIEYVAMALLGELQSYCDIETDMVKSVYGNIVQDYLKRGYSKAMAETLAREFFRYES